MMKLITLHLLNSEIESLNKLVDKKLYPNRAEAIRFAVKDLVELHSKDLE